MMNCLYSSTSLSLAFCRRSAIASVRFWRQCCFSSSWDLKRVWSTSGLAVTISSSSWDSPCCSRASVYALAIEKLSRIDPPRSDAITNSPALGGASSTCFHSSSLKSALPVNLTPPSSRCPFSRRRIRLIDEELGRRRGEKRRGESEADPDRRLDRGCRGHPPGAQ